MRALGGSPLTWRLAAWWGARTHVDQETCTRCGLCARFCPTGNIRMEGYPRFLGRCQDCLRCLGLCPVHALRVFGLRYQPYKAMSFTDLERLDPPSGP